VFLLGALFGLISTIYLGVGVVCYLAMICLDPHNTNLVGLHIVLTWPFVALYYLIKDWRSE
jgi:hypothetical protein